MSDGGTMDLSTAMTYAQWLAIGLGVLFIVSAVVRKR